MNEPSKHVDQSSTWGALPAPQPYDTAAPYSRVARIDTATAIVFVDLLLGQLRVDFTNVAGRKPTRGQWQPFISAGAIAVGRPALFRLNANVPLLTDRVHRIYWLGNGKEIPARDLEALRIIGSHLTTRRRSFRRWWHA